MKLRQDGHRDKERKQRRDGKKKKLINFISSLSLPLLVRQLLSSSSKVHLTTACLSPSVSHTEAEAERTHTKCMDMVKRRGRKKIYKRGRNTWCRERQSGRFGNPLSPRLFSKDSSKKKTQRFRFRETV